LRPPRASFGGPRVPTTLRGAHLRLAAMSCGSGALLQFGFGSLTEQAKVLLVSLTGWSDSRAFTGLVEISQREERRPSLVGIDVRTHLFSTESLPPVPGVTGAARGI
jgi:hypothetical protein